MMRALVSAHCHLIRCSPVCAFADGCKAFSATSTASEENFKTISIDRSGLYNVPEHSHVSQLHKEPETKLAKLLKALIRFRGGPISVAEFMSEALTNPSAGYYTQRDVFGRSGDFVTSPEISQLFGEMVGVWVANHWQQIGSPQKLYLVEIGPGRGTLMADLLRGTSTLKRFAAALQIHLVEVSRPMRGLQEKALGCEPGRATSEVATSAMSRLTNTQISWHERLESVPRDAPAIFIAHELFDALPAHQFQRQLGGSWAEQLIDIAPDASPLHFQMVLAPGQTPAAKLLVERRLKLLPAHEREAMTAVEISPQSMVMAEALAERVATQGGAALVIDYGRDAPYPGSLQGIRDHRFVHFLSSPGAADLSCRVDFSALRQSIEHSGAEVAVHGPMPQAFFLAGLGIEARLDMLLRGKLEAEQASLIAGFNRLIGFDEAEAHHMLSTQDHSPQSEAGPGGIVNAEKSKVSASGQAALRSATLSADQSSIRSAPDAEASRGASDEGLAAGGMGMTYKALAIVPKGQTVPLPFPGSGVTFE